MVSCSKIYEYWCGKGILENGKISDDLGLAIIENDYLPSCWACGKLVNGKDIFSWDKYIEEEPKKLWSDKKVNSKLQKCHILAKQFDGQDTPENLFLMCADCHAESPDVKNREAFFRWVYRRRKERSYGININEMLSLAEYEIKSRGYDPMEFLHMFNVEEVEEIVKECWGECGLHGTHIAESSVVIALIDAMEKRVKVAV